MKTLILLLGMTLACITASAQKDTTKVATKDSTILVPQKVHVEHRYQQRLANYDREVESIKLQSDLSLEAVKSRINLVLDIIYEEAGVTRADIDKAEYKGDTIYAIIRKKYVPPVAKPKKK